MHPTDVQRIGDELAIKWADGTETFLRLETLRRHCPCAACQGEPDVLGNLHRGPPTTLTPRSFELVELRRVGSYALQPIWADGHNSGLYAFDYLRSIAPPTR